MNNYYDVLGLPRSATNDEISAAYRDKAKMYHPDKYANNPLSHLAEEQMKKINEAYEILGDPKKRIKYDSHLSKQGGSAQFSGSGHENVNSGHVACYYHSNIEATTMCPSCNKPLCMVCATQFNIPSCPDCLLVYNQQYLSSLRKPLVGTGIASVIGFLLFAFNGENPLPGLLLGVVLYWGWRELSHAFEIGFFASLFSGVFGLLIALPFALLFAFFMGIVKALVNVPLAGYTYFRERKMVKEAEVYIMNMKKQQAAG